MIADVDHYVENSEAIEQTECSKGTHQPLVGQSECIDVDEGILPGLSGISTIIIVLLSGVFVAMYRRQ